MKNEVVYLKNNIVLEPLFANWYAWPHLISPATAAMNVLDRHIKIMKSYIQAPEAHAQAVKNPKMLGGPFMDYPEDYTTKVKQLLEKTFEKQAHLISFANAVRELNKILVLQGKGASLSELYSKVPEELKGYVELVYDVNNRASFRFIEALLYYSPYYDSASHSVAFYHIEEDYRPFILSTPRLKKADVLHLTIPFSHHAIDELYRMQRHPKPYKYIRELLDIVSEDEKLFQTFFTTETPKAYDTYKNDDIRIRYFGHACILTETKQVNILVDPVISYGYDSNVSRYTYSDLPDKIDYVLITHNHQDHILLETMLQLRHRIGKIIVPKNGNGSLQDPNLKLMFKHLGFNNIIEIDELEEIILPECTITGIPFLGEHGDLDIRTKVCYHVKFDDASILFAADSCNIEPCIYEKVYKIIGDIDILFLGMECDGAPVSWLYGPLLTEQLPREKDHTRRLAGSDYNKGIHLVDCFHPKEVYVYAMGQEPWLNHIMSIKYTDESNPIIASNKLIENCLIRNINAERLFGEKEIRMSNKMIKSLSKI